MKGDTTKKVILEAGDGPDGITLYTSENEGVVDWADSLPALYLTASVNGASVKLGPFIKGVRDQVLERLKA